MTRGIKLSRHKYNVTIFQNLAQKVVELFDCQIDICQGSGVKGIFLKVPGSIESLY